MMVEPIIAFLLVVGGFMFMMYLFILAVVLSLEWIDRKRQK